MDRKIRAAILKKSLHLTLESLPPGFISFDFRRNSPTASNFSDVSFFHVDVAFVLFFLFSAHRQNVARGVALDLSSRARVA
jgi:hypothetical protein